MTALTLIITDAGLARFTAAQAGGAIDLTIASVGLTAADFVPAPTLTALPGEHTRLASVSGKVVGPGFVHLTIRDDPGQAYTVRGFGLFLADGTLFAVCAQAIPIAEKSAVIALYLALDLAFPLAGVDKLVFGDTNFLLPQATVDTLGLVELATEAEADAGSKGALAITAALLARAVSAVKTYSDNAVRTFSKRRIRVGGLVSGGGDLTEDRTITVSGALFEDMLDGTRHDVAVTPAALTAIGAVFLRFQKLTANGGYRVWSDGLKECWGSILVAANATTAVPLPIEHLEFCVPVGSCSIQTNEASIGIVSADAGGFTVRNPNALATTFYWQTKGV